MDFQYSSGCPGMLLDRFVNWAEMKMDHVRVTGRPQINWSFFEGKMNTFRGLTSRDFYAGYKGIQGMPKTFYLEGQYLRTSSYSATGLPRV